jgi:hypothetical protein
MKNPNTERTKNETPKAEANSVCESCKPYCIEEYFLKNEILKTQANHQSRVVIVHTIRP